MTIFYQSPTNDISTDSSGQFMAVTGKEAYANIIADAIRTVKGEIQLDTEKGVPYFDTVFSTYGGIAQWDNAVRSIINAYPFVTHILSFTSSIDSTSKTLNYSITIQTDEGEITVEN